MKSEIFIGDCRDVLKSLPTNSINCCVTSPPYFNLRSYLSKEHPDKIKEIGSEKIPDEYVNNLVEVFREVKRVLRDDGTVFLNLGDSYAGSNQGAVTKNPSAIQASNTGTNYMLSDSHKSKLKHIDGLKPKDLIGIPWRVAFALQADGWYLRQDIIWSKNNPMPESVKDRCTKSHEYIFLLSKSPKYYFDNDSIKEPAVSSDNIVRDRDSTKLNNTPGRTKMKGLKTNNYEFRNKRSVWNINNVPYKGAHFACFPPALVIPCILVGCPENGYVLDPFAGSGTVGKVCNTLKRNSILIELNSDYKQLIEQRINEVPPHAKT